MTLKLSGEVLATVSVTLSSGFRHHRIQLIFGSGIRSISMSDANKVEILLDPVISYKILDWWHPLYPHEPAQIPDLLTEE